MAVASATSPAALASGDDVALAVASVDADGLDEVLDGLVEPDGAGAVPVSVPEGVELVEVPEPPESVLGVAPVGPVVEETEGAPVVAVPEGVLPADGSTHAGSLRRIARICCS